MKGVGMQMHAHDKKQDAERDFSWQQSREGAQDRTTVGRR